MADSSRIDIAYVEILPDLKKFDSTAEKEVTKALKGASKAADAAATDIEKSFDDASVSISISMKQASGDISKMTANAAKSSREYFKETKAAAQDLIADVERAAKAADPTVTVKVDLDTQLLEHGLKRDINGKIRDLKGKFASAGQLAGLDLGDGIVEGVGDSLSKGLSGIGSSLGTAVLPAMGALGSTLGIALVATLAPVVISGLAAAATSAAALIAGAGILGIGAFALKENERLVAEATSTAEKIKGVFARAAEPLIEPFSKALTGIGKIVQGLEPTLRGLFAGMAPAVSALTQALGPTLTPILNGLSKALPGINAAFSGLAKGMPIIGEAIGNFFEQVFKDSPVIEKLTRDFVVFTAWILDIAAPAIRVLTVLFAAFTNLVRMSAHGWAAIWEAMKAAFDGGTGAIDRITAAWAPLKDAIFAVWDALVQFAAADTDEQLATSLTNLVTKIKEAWGPLREFLGVIWDEAWAFIQRVWSDNVIPWWNGTAKPFLEKEIKSFVAGIFRSMVEDAVATLLSFPLRAAGALAGLGSSIQGAVLRAVAGAAGWLYNAGSSIVQGLINGLLGRIGALASTAAHLGQIILDNKGPESYDRVMLRPAGKLIVQGLEEGLESERPILRRQVRGMTSEISESPASAINSNSSSTGGVDPGGAAGTGTGVRVWGNQASSTSPTEIVINTDGTKLSDLLVEVMSKAVRLRGGNVQQVLGKAVGGVA